MPPKKVQGRGRPVPRHELQQLTVPGVQAPEIFPVSSVVHLQYDPQETADTQKAQVQVPLHKIEERQQIVSGVQYLEICSPPSAVHAQHELQEIRDTLKTPEQVHPLRIKERQQTEPGMHDREVFPPPLAIHIQLEPQGFGDTPRRAPELVPPRKVEEKQRIDEVGLEAVGLHLGRTLAPNTPLFRRPSYGTLGKRIGLFVNYFPVEIPSGYVYHYDVDIVSINKTAKSEATVSDSPPLSSDKKYRCMSTKRNREVINAMLKVHMQFQRLKPSYDGRKNLYTKEPLEGIPYSIKVILDDGAPPQEGGYIPTTDVFQVAIKAVQKKETNSCAISLEPLHALFDRKINYVPQEAVMALETILRNGPCFRYVPVGRSFFACSFEGVQPLDKGRDIWFGYHQSLHLGEWQPMVNINVTATTFYREGPVIDFLCDFFNWSMEDLYRTPQLKDADRIKLNKEIKNLRIKVTHLNYPRKYRIVKLTRNPASRLIFDIEDGGRKLKKKVTDYFLDQYNFKLKYPNLPCLHVAPENKNIYLPLEICDILDDQHCKKKLTENQTAVMIRATAISPRDRFDKIVKIVKNADFNNDEYNREFGLRINEIPMKVEGRVLNPPNVRYDNEQRILPRDGSWDMRDKQFFHGAEIQTWVLLSFANKSFCGERELEKFANMLFSVGRSCGIVLNRPALIDIVDKRRFTVDRLLRDVIKAQYNADLAVIVIPERDPGIYGEVKQVAETSLCLTTQCVKDCSVVKKCNPALVSNICQKINAKMGGVNSSLTPGETPEILKRPVMIIGADVTHPGPSSDIKPSLAAVVGSLDAHPSRYAVAIRAQKHTKENKQALEIIADLEVMVKELLKAFYKSTRGKKPEKIIFYRDGVSEGQFETVRNAEITAVHRACRSLSGDYEPGITFIVVQKRHHTRFMPQDHREGVGRMKNIPPGTTVDQKVTHPLNFDFFLCSHFGLQGTSRPSHYTVLFDDNKFTPDDLQKLTYYLCHTYVRCTKSISVPAPVQYAHLAAFRAREHLKSQMDESSASSQTSTIQELPQNVTDSIRVNEDLKNTMYFV